MYRSVRFSFLVAGASLVASSALAAQNNGGGPNVISIGELQGQGYTCIKTDNFQTMCMKGGSIYICPDSVTCIETARKADPKYTVPRTGNLKVAPAP